MGHIKHQHYIKLIHIPIQFLHIHILRAYYNLNDFYIHWKFKPRELLLILVVITKDFEVGKSVVEKSLDVHLSRCGEILHLAYLGLVGWGLGCISTSGWRQHGDQRNREWLGCTRGGELNVIVAEQARIQTKAWREVDTNANSWHFQILDSFIKQKRGGVCQCTRLLEHR